MRRGAFRILVQRALLAACLSIGAGHAVAEGASKPAQDAASMPAKSSDGARATAAQLPGPSTNNTQFNDWLLQCLPDSKAKPACQISYRLNSPDKKQVVLVLSLALFPDSSSRLQMALPLGFAIPPGVRVTFGSDFSLLAQVSRCTLQGCLVEGEGSGKMISAMHHEKSGQVSVKDVDGNEITLPVSLDGFSAAYAALKEKS